MQWLNQSTERSDRERGAVAVVVALLMVPLIGFTALAIDVASMWSQQQRLQVASDASALAVAQDCARNNCGQPLTTAQGLTDANFGTGATARILTPSLSPSTGTVQVSATTNSHFLFAPVLGFSSHTVGAVSTAAWGAPSGGPTILPITFSYSCLFNSTTSLPDLGVQQVIYPYDPTTHAAGCSVPGGFGWVDTDPNKPGQCIVDSSILDVLSSDPGKSMSNPCKDQFAALLASTQAGKPVTVLLPVFATSTGTGTAATYTISGYAAFILEGYSFPGTQSDNAKSICKNNNCLIGYFTRFVDIGDVFPIGPTAPDFGAEIVKLTA